MTEENRESYTCGSCKLYHPNVEARGIWHCPNALCRGCGGAWFRRTLDSYRELENETHTVDENEWLEKGIAHNKKTGIGRRVFRKRRLKNK